MRTIITNPRVVTRSSARGRRVYRLAIMRAAMDATVAVVLFGWTIQWRVNGVSRRGVRKKRYCDRVRDVLYNYFLSKLKYLFIPK